ncbi:hypothetical protein ACFL56_03125 [Candidatus Margulisiibacteriota bacterium]
MKKYKNFIEDYSAEMAGVIQDSYSKQIQSYKDVITSFVEGDEELKDKIFQFNELILIKGIELSTTFIIYYLFFTDKD